MANNNIEIEIKFPLRNSAEAFSFLNKKAKLISKNIYQRDAYFTPTHRNFLAEKYPFEWLRLRKSPKGEFITYKHFHPEGAEKTDYCDEFETKVNSLEALEKMFNSLDFKELVVVEKKRTTWIFKNVEIVIDEVTDLGFYIELEITSAFDNPEEGKVYLYQLLKEWQIEVGEEDIRGYPFQLLANKGYTFGN